VIKDQFRRYNYWLQGGFK